MSWRLLVPFRLWDKFPNFFLVMAVPQSARTPTQSEREQVVAGEFLKGIHEHSIKHMNYRASVVVAT